MATRSGAGMGFVSSGLVAAALVFTAASTGAQTIIDQWSSVKVPPAPGLKKVKADPQTTAFLVLDLISQICTEPSCIDTLPKVAKFLDEARVHKMPVVYSVSPGHDKKDILPQVAPKPGEPIVSFHADKFIDTDLEKLLKDRKISTVIVVGTLAEGAVLYTSSHAAFLGLKVIVPVDGMSSDPFGELATTWILANAPSVGDATTLTSFDMIEW